MKCSATAAAWFSTFFEKPLVKRVKRRIPIHIVRLVRSTCDVLMWAGSELPNDRPLFNCLDDVYAVAAGRRAAIV